MDDPIRYGAESARYDTARQVLNELTALAYIRHRMAAMSLQNGRLAVSRSPRQIHSYNMAARQLFAEFSRYRLINSLPSTVYNSRRITIEILNKMD